MQPGKQANGQRPIAQLHGGQGGTVQNSSLLGVRLLLERLILGLGQPYRQDLRVGLHQHTRPGRHQPGHPICGRVRCLAAHVLRRGIDPDAGLHIGHALGGQRMAAQIGERAPVAEAPGLLQDREHVHEPLGRKTCLAQHRKTNAVGLPLHITRIVELALHRQCLASHDGGVRSLRILCALAGRQHAQYQSAQNPRCHRILAAHAAGDMALGHVAEFVRQHRGQLGAGLGRSDKPQM